MANDSLYAPEDLWYRLDDEDRIVSVSPEWWSFASENGAPELNADLVVKQSVYRFIRDPETQRLYQAVFQKVRSTGKVVSLPFRCDSPALRRWLEITIKPVAPGNTLELATRLLEFQPRILSLSLLEPRPHSLTRLTICSWCERIKHPEKDWVDVDVAVNELNLFDNVDLPALDPGVCPACINNVRDKL